MIDPDLTGGCPHGPHPYEEPVIHFWPLENYLDDWQLAPDPDHWLRRHLLRFILEDCDAGLLQLTSAYGDVYAVDLAHLGDGWSVDTTVVTVGWSPVHPGCEEHRPAPPATVGGGSDVYAVIARDQLRDYCATAGIDMNLCSTLLRYLVPYLEPPLHEVGGTARDGTRSTFSLAPWLDADHDNLFLVIHWAEADDSAQQNADERPASDV